MISPAAGCELVSWLVAMAGTTSQLAVEAVHVGSPWIDRPCSAELTALTTKQPTETPHQLRDVHPRRLMSWEGLLSLAACLQPNAVLSNMPSADCSRTDEPSYTAGCAPHEQLTCPLQLPCVLAGSTRHDVQGLQG